jgi:hypothetical protein
MEKVKTTKKGSKAYHYWMAGWREATKYAISTLVAAKMDATAALQKARR